MTTQTPQSLPSFAQAFGAPSLSRIADANNALPPIHSRASPLNAHGRSPSVHDDSPSLPPMSDVPRQSSRKRARPETQAQAEENHSSGSDERRSPKTVRIKEESEYDAVPSPTSRTALHSLDERESESQPTAHSQGAAAAPAPAPSAARPSPNKKRRVTISGISHPINTDVRPPPPTDPNSSISPVVIGLPIPRDNTAAIEQVRSMLSVKQQQKDLIEQRRGSTAGLAGPPPVDSPAPQAPVKSHASTRTGVRSPITTAPPRRSGVALSANAPPNRAVSPLARQASPPPHHPQHSNQPSMLHLPHPPMPVQEQHGPGMHQHALPAPPISFARRRATRQLGGAKGKPADIMISPRDAIADRLQPSIQSAPPIPRAGPMQGMTGRFSSMALPSLPPVLGPGQSTPRTTTSRVPPTPTRLSLARNAPASTSILTPTVGSISSAAVAGRSPPTASVPIATTLVPPTPASLQHPGYTGEKAAFLAPFEMFYDALADSRTLKHWLGEQLQKSQALAAQLQRQQEHLDELVAAAAERRIAPVREELAGLQRRVDELELALHHATGGNAAVAAAGLVRTTSSGTSHAQAPGQVQGYSPSMGTTTLTKGKAKVNGVPESYQFPPPPSATAADGPGGPGVVRRPEPVRRALSPTQLDRDRESRSFPGSQTGSPVPFDVGRRLSISAMRLDPRSPVVSETPAPGHRGSASSANAGGAATPHSRDRERERERERELGGRTLPPPPSAAPAGSGSWNRPWSPRGVRTSLPSSTSATRSSLSHEHGRPGIVRRASAQRVAGERYAYPSHDPGETRERDKEKDREREREASSPPPPPPPAPSHSSRRDVHSPEPMEE